MEKLTVAVVMGGVSPEHEVSINSGFGMYSRLDMTKFHKFPILISRNNTWYWPKSEMDIPYTPEYFSGVFSHPPAHWNQIQFPCFENFPSADIFLLGLHGIGGEDGTFQGFLDLVGQPYTGSGCLGSALAMDKIKSKELYQAANIPTPPYIVASSQDDTTQTVQNCQAKLSFPCVVKDPMGGSSLGVAIAKTSAELSDLLTSEFKRCQTILLEKYIQGREATCGYISNFKCLPPTEIIPQEDDFFNYEAKYQSNRTREVTPANFPSHITKKLQTLAQRCHNLMGLSIYSRTDFIVRENDITVLETNSLPGFTDTSIIPQEAEAAGLNYSDLLSHLIEQSLKKSTQNKNNIT